MTKNKTAAEPFIATRSHHQKELAEDYVEIVHDLVSMQGEARVRDIASRIGVSHVTVIRTIDRLKKRGYFKDEPAITLTEEAEELAKRCKERHTFLLDYLIALGVPENIAKIDVEGMEHHISPETLNAFRTHITHEK